MRVEKSTLAYAIVVALLLIVGAWSQNDIFYRIIIALMVAICLDRGKRQQCLVNPFYLFLLTPISLLIYCNISDKYMENLTTGTWFIATLNILSFVVGLDVTSKSEQHFTEEVNEEDIDFKQLITLFCCLGFIPRMLHLFFKISLPLYSVFSLLSASSLFCAIKSRKKVYIAIVVALNLCIWMVDVSKTEVLMNCLACLIAFESRKKEFDSREKRKSIAFIIIAVCVMLASFSFANQARGAKTAMSQLEYYSRYGGVRWSRNAVLFMPYMYLTTPWANLQYVMRTQPSKLFGLWTIKPIISWLQLDGILQNQYQMVAKSSFNTFTFIACEFKDFGVVGSAIITFFLGTFVGHIFRCTNNLKNTWQTMMYIYIALAVLEMFFSNHFFQVGYPFTIGILILMCKIAIQRRVRRKSR